MRKLIILLMFLFLPGVALAGKDVKVKVQKSTLFQEPRFFSTAVASVRYGDQLEMLDEAKDWAYVRWGDQKGWIHKSSLTSAKVNLGTILVGSSSSSASPDEVALAGKGFNPEVERGYQKTHPEMKYALVDEVEGYDVDDKSLREFIRSGSLRIKEVER
jgi:ABC-type amino acid transport substrate-binding protein